jgi:carboxyl-terminal processing protease
MRKSQIVVWVFLIVAGIVAGNTVLNLSRTHEAVAANSEIYRQLDLFGEVLERVRADYVEAPDDRELIEAAINGMLSGLDPHSAYLSPKSFREMQVQTRGEFGGLGIEVTMENEVVKVVSPIANTPAEEAGLLSGDYITHLDGDSIRGLTLGEAVEKMRGPVDSEIVLTVVREGMSEPFDIRIKRDIIRITPVSYEIEDDIGYLRVKTFNEQTYDELRDAISSVQDELGDELRGYILDLRNNPGGLLDQAIAVSDAFLDQGAIVLTRGRKSSESQRASAKGGDLTAGKPIVVLINGGSASASEIVAGALQDQERAEVVGSRSFGKGSVQTIIPLGTDGAIRLTTARYYTPSGRSIQAKGISPDYAIKQELPEEMKDRLTKPRGEAALRGHLSAEDGEETSGSVAYVPKEKEKDTQLQFAIALLNGEVPEEQEKAQNTAAPEQEAAN